MPAAYDMPLLLTSARCVTPSLASAIPSLELDTGRPISLPKIVPDMYIYLESTRRVDTNEIGHSGTNFYEGRAKISLSPLRTLAGPVKQRRPARGRSAVQWTDTVGTSPPVRLVQIGTRLGRAYQRDLSLIKPYKLACTICSMF